VWAKISLQLDHGHDSGTHGKHHGPKRDWRGDRFLQAYYCSLVCWVWCLAKADTFIQVGNCGLWGEWGSYQGGFVYGAGLGASDTYLLPSLCPQPIACVSSWSSALPSSPPPLLYFLLFYSSPVTRFCCACSSGSLELLSKVTNPMTTTIRIPPYSKCSTILQTFFSDRT
jgi:hypothetical protein